MNNRSQIEYSVNRNTLKAFAGQHIIKRALLVGTVGDDKKIQYTMKLELKSSAHSHVVVGKNGRLRVWGQADSAVDYLYKVGITEIGIILRNNRENDL
ncbi:hypothetical protein L6019_RS23490 [Escherichia coli]|nr:hypothetical protein [Escherichia coli]EKG7113517.1 hypothetical protein [Escherichia coli]EKR4920341.1 hypothetical protein [Escherichia coli]ELM8776554.1 hypothetical protein [Escherichia coli]EMA4402869.1 hypothetical protein [Escherichia coli]